MMRERWRNKERERAGNAERRVGESRGRGDGRAGDYGETYSYFKRKSAPCWSWSNTSEIMNCFRWE